MPISQSLQSTLVAPTPTIREVILREGGDSYFEGTEHHLETTPTDGGVRELWHC